KSRQRWLFYAYDSLRKTVVAHVFGERTMATLGRLMSLLSPFDVVIWMTDGWPLYESRLKGKLHVISKRYTQRIERHNLNLRQHLARLGRKSLSFSKSVELHDKGKRLVRTVLIFTESSDQLSRATDRVPGLPASPGYVQ
ncbi:IS1 family transposase, partial [Escherichia coli]|nr:IS1 family transposase [Escherichia coli]MED8965525.1 IS1 family transposase [Escherichia coli]MED9126333.1 IS1 family transposase [Escherichia coli]